MKDTSKKRNLCDKLETFIPSSGAIYLIYGERGVGKTVFLVNLFKCILVKKNFEVYFFTRTSIGNIKQLNALLRDTFHELLSKNILLCDMDVSEEGCSLLIKEIVFNIFIKTLYKRKKSGNKIVLFIDDLISHITLKNLKSFSFLPSLLLLGRRLNAISYISLDEDLAYPLPAKENASLLWVTDFLIRIKKVRRMREAYKFDFRNFNLLDSKKEISLLLKEMKKRLRSTIRFFIDDKGALKIV